MKHCNYCGPTYGIHEHDAQNCPLHAMECERLREEDELWEAHVEWCEHNSKHTEEEDL